MHLILSRGFYFMVTAEKARIPAYNRENLILWEQRCRKVASILPSFPRTLSVLICAYSIRLKRPGVAEYSRLHGTNQIWHTLVPGLKAGQCYGYLRSWPFQTCAKGHALQSGQAAARSLRVSRSAVTCAGDPEMFAYRIGGPEEDLSKERAATKTPIVCPSRWSLIPAFRLGEE